MRQTIRRPRSALLRRLALACAVLLAAALPAGAGPTLVMDLGTGRVLSHEDAFKRWYPASLTKLMTVYVALRAVEAGELTLLSPIDITEQAAKEPPSKMGYAPGSVLTLDNAIKILMVKSANDVATAVAQTVGGSVAAFTTRMNAEAERLGMRDSHFVNAHGLHSEAQYTTARDLAVLAAAMHRDFPEHSGYFSIPAIRSGETVMPNHNDLIGRFAGADGMKTGYTCPSGFNLVATATRNGRQLLAVVIGARYVEERAARAAELLTQGFATADAAAPTLATLATYGEDNTAAVNLRETICTAEWQEEIAALRATWAESQAPVSPYLSDATEPSEVVAVALGGATGPRTIQPRYADVPIPTPRPAYQPANMAAPEPDESASTQLPLSGAPVSQ